MEAGDKRRVFELDVPILCYTFLPKPAVWNNHPRLSPPKSSAKEGGNEDMVSPK